LEEKKMKSIKRRDFLRLAAVTTAGAALVSCAPKATDAVPTSVPPTAVPQAEATAVPVAEATAVPVVEEFSTGSLMTQKAAGQEIDVWGWDKPEFNKVVEDYVKESAGVTINGQSIGYDDLWKKLTTSSAAGTGLPDGFKITSTAIPQLVEMGAVMDMTPLTDTVKDLLPEVAWTMTSYNGKVYGVAANSPAAGFFWRYDICEKYGIDPDKVKTWDQYIEAGKKMATDSGNKNFLMYTPAVGIGTTFMVLQQENRASLLTSDMQIAIGPDSQPWLDTLAMAKKLRDAGISTVVNEWTEPWYQAIKDGSLACYPIGTWFVETIKQQAPDTQGKWYFTPFAAMVEGGDPYVNFGSATCCIGSQTSKTDAAWEWVKAWTLDPHGSLDLGLIQLGFRASAWQL
jgi:ABC-type glycerol-3-phosphate transport system substrate-binding protein